MQFEMSSLIPVIPELFLLAAACAILVVDLFLEEERRAFTYGMAQASLVITALLAMVTSPGAGGDARLLFDGAVVRDFMGDVLKVAVCAVSAGAFLYAKDYLRNTGLFKGEFYTLGLFAVLGMMVMISSASFLTVYLGLELLALSLYALVAFDRDSRAGPEAAMKYFVLGALASGMLLYGISMIYGATGALGFPEVAAALGDPGSEQLVLIFGLVFVVIGVAFKFGAVPLHMWVPDVYHGAPTAVAMFVSSAPKVAAFALAIRLLVDGLGGLHGDWQGMLVILAVLSMAVGNVVAIAQSNIKRMLAYSTIAHVGFILLGILAGTGRGYAAAMFYSIVYAVMALGAFGIVILLSRRGFEADSLDDYRGLHDRSPWFAAMMLFFMFSMTGVPPMVGFFAKMFVLEAVIKVDMVWLALVGVFFSIIGAYYYLRIVKLMYFDKPVDDTPLTAGMDARILLSVNGLSMVVLGLFPASIMSFCVAAFPG